MRLAGAALALAALGTSPRAQAPSSPLGGVWTLNRPLSDMPRELGFNVDWAQASPADGAPAPAAGGGGRGRRGGGGGGGGGRSAGGAFPTRRESSEDARRLQLLTQEARNPPSRLMIVDTPGAVTITNELGQSRVLHPDGREETIEIQGVPVAATTNRDADKLIVVYRVEQGRQIRYIYSHTPNPSQLVVELQFLERGDGDKARRIYDAGIPTETSAPAATAAPAGGAPADLPATGGSRETFDAGPGAELHGIKAVGILVEELSQQAVSCGLNRDAIETGLAKRLRDAGFSVRANSDDDTYVYVNVITTTMPNGACVSRYDAFLYTHATANLSYREKPVLVQVSLMHRGGLASTAPTAHAASVMRGLENYVDLISAQIKNANR